MPVLDAHGRTPSPQPGLPPLSVDLRGHTPGRLAPRLIPSAHPDNHPDAEIGSRGSRAGPDSLIQSYVLRHLGIVEHRAGHLGQARRHLEESTRLRRQLGFGPGVAANLVGLAYIAAADGRDEEVTAILDEADSIASGSDAAGITRQIEEARRGLTR